MQDKAITPKQMVTYIKDVIKDNNILVSITKSYDMEV